MALLILWASGGSMKSNSKMLGTLSTFNWRITLPRFDLFFCCVFVFMRCLCGRCGDW